MQGDTFNNLSPLMQERLDKWKANVLPISSRDTIRRKWPPNYRAVRGDYGDDISDFESKENEMWRRNER